MTRRQQIVAVRRSTFAAETVSASDQGAGDIADDSSASGHPNESASTEDMEKGAEATSASDIQVEL